MGLFYRSSVLVGILVGLSFMISPVSPIALFEAEAPATHFLRQVPHMGPCDRPVTLRHQFQMPSLALFTSLISALSISITLIAMPPCGSTRDNAAQTVALAGIVVEQGLGIYIVALLAPVQASLLRSAETVGGLGTGAARRLNAITGLCCGLLVCDGKFQVAQGTAGFESLEKG